MLHVKAIQEKRVTLIMCSFLRLFIFIFMSEQKIRIEPGTVQETLLIPLYCRRKCVERFPDLFHDAEAVKLFDRIDYVPEREPMEYFCLTGGIRQNDFIIEIKEYLKDHPRACVVNMGCGLDTTFYQVDNGTTKGYNVDFPDVINIRNELLPPRERETNIASDLTDHAWFDKIDFKKADGAVFIAGGVLCYITHDDVKSLLCGLADHFPGGKAVFDVVSPLGSRMVTWRLFSSGKRQAVIMNFASKHPDKELSMWSPNFAKVDVKQYWYGYMDVDKRWGYVTRSVFWWEEVLKLGQIVIISFKFSVSLPTLAFDPRCFQQTHHNSISSCNIASLAEDSLASIP